MAARQPGFDRVRRRAPVATTERVRADAVPDQEGKRVLFSGAEQPASVGGVVFECSRCGERSVVSLGQAVQAAVPSVHLPWIRRYGSWLRCPACRQRSWVRVGFRG